MSRSWRSRAMLAAAVWLMAKVVAVAVAVMVVQ